MPRIGALDSRVYVHSRPSSESAEIGVLHIGSSVRLRKPKAVGTNGCTKGWYAVEPSGFVCLDETTTLDVDRDPILAAKREHHGDFDSALPFRWAESRETPLYRKLPTMEEQESAEYELGRHLARVKAGRPHRSLEGVDTTPATGEPPSFLRDGELSPWSLLHTPADQRPRAKTVPPRSAIAFTDEFLSHGRSWVLTDDLLIAPKDKIAIFSPSNFHGVHIDGDHVRLPVVFIRGEDRPKFRLVLEPIDGVEARRDVPMLTPVSFEKKKEARIEDETDPLVGFLKDERPGVIESTSEVFPRLSSIGITGRVRRQKGVRYLETSEKGRWIREHDATVVQAQPPRGFELVDREKWIDISIFWGTLVAYEGEQAVFATLISPGANSYKRIDGEPAKYTTPTGTFRIEWKHLSTTMMPHPDRPGYYLSEVPFTQFFHMPFALHAAYWHDCFGEPKSGGCVNLSPEDAKWLFGWTEPELPEGWHAVRSGDGRGDGTLVRVR